MEKHDQSLHKTLQEHNDTVASALLFDLEHSNKDRLLNPEAKLFQYVHDYVSFDKELKTKEEELSGISAILDDLSGKLNKSPSTNTVRTLEPGEIEESLELFQSLEKEYQMLESKFNAIKEEIERIEAEQKFIVSEAQKINNTNRTAFMSLVVKYEDSTMNTVDPKAN